MEDKIRQALSGDANAFLQLMDAMSDHMYKTAFAILKNDEDVADAIQDTIISCYEKLGTLKEPRYFGTWAMRILINASLHILKRRTPCLDASDDVLSFIPAADDGFSGMRFKELLAMAQRYEVAMMLTKKMTYLDIADKTGASTATISRVNRSLTYGEDGYTLVFGRLGVLDEEKKEE